MSNHVPTEEKLVPDVNADMLEDSRLCDSVAERVIVSFNPDMEDVTESLVIAVGVRPIMPSGSEVDVIEFAVREKLPELDREWEEGLEGTGVYDVALGSVDEVTV